jgi:hypothetical protein
MSEHMFTMRFDDGNISLQVSPVMEHAAPVTRNEALRIAKALLNAVSDSDGIPRGVQDRKTRHVGGYFWLITGFLSFLSFPKHFFLFWGPPVFRINDEEAVLDLEECERGAPCNPARTCRIHDMRRLLGQIIEKLGGEVTSGW